MPYRLFSARIQQTMNLPVATYLHLNKKVFLHFQIQVCILAAVDPSRTVSCTHIFHSMTFTFELGLYKFKTNRQAKCQWSWFRSYYLGL